MKSLLIVRAGKNVPQDSGVAGQPGDCHTDMVINPDHLLLVRGKLPGRSLWTHASLSVPTVNTICQRRLELALSVRRIA